MASIISSETVNGTRVISFAWQGSVYSVTVNTSYPDDESVVQDYIANNLATVAPTAPTVTTDPTEAQGVPASGYPDA